MKYAWLLAFPYIVVVSSISRLADKGGIETAPIYSVDRFNCMYDKSLCQDLAEALNDAHKRRIGTDNMESVLYWKKSNDK